MIEYLAGNYVAELPLIMLKTLAATSIVAVEPSRIELGLSCLA